MKPYTVVLLNLDRNAAWVKHVEASDPRDAYLTALRTIFDNSEPGPDDVFDVNEAEFDRPLLCVFEGHHADQAA